MMKSRGKLIQCIQRIASGCFSARRIEGWDSPSGRGMLASIGVCSGVLSLISDPRRTSMPSRLHGEFTPGHYRADPVNAFWNAVRFGNGVQFLLQRLDEGERVRDCSSRFDRPLYGVQASVLSPDP